MCQDIIYIGFQTWGGEASPCPIPTPATPILCMCMLSLTLFGLWMNQLDADPAPIEQLSSDDDCKVHEHIARGPEGERKARAVAK